ncbi:unnamed protein product, partial [Ectocarpus sp. 4 AP-2014]
MSSRREDEVDKSILGVLSKTTGSFQRELQALTTDLFSSVESGSAPTNGGGGGGTAAQRQRGGPGESSLGRVAGGGGTAIDTFQDSMFHDGGDGRQATLGAPRVDSTSPKSSTMPRRAAAAAAGGGGGGDKALDAQVARSVSLSISMAGRWDEEGGGGGGGGGGGKLKIRKRFTLKVVDLGSIGGDMGHRALPLTGGAGGTRGSGGVGLRARATTETTSLPDSGRTRSFSLTARGEPEAAAAATSAPPVAGRGNIVDVIVVHGSDPVPPGYSKLERSSGGKRADLNTGARGQYVYLAVKRDTPLVDQAEGDDVSHPGGGRMVGVPAVVALALIFPDRGETVPPMFQKVRRRGTPVDLNAGTNGERSYLCYKRGTTNPITDIQ